MSKELKEEKSAIAYTLAHKSKAQINHDYQKVAKREEERNY